MGGHVVPTKLKLLRGNPGKRPIGDEPQPVVLADAPEPPGHLGKDAAEEWRRVMPELVRLGLATIVDVQTLAAYCDAYGNWITAKRSIAEIAEHDPKFNGLVGRDDHGRLVVSPLVRVAANAARDMVSYAGQCGLTPASRARLNSGITRPPKKFSGLVAAN